MRSADLARGFRAEVSRRWRSRLLALLVLTGPAVAHAARSMPLNHGLNTIPTDPLAPVQITVERQVNMPVSGGFFTARVSIRNDAPSALVWSAALRSPRWNYYGGEDGARPPRFESRGVELAVPARASREFFVALPVPGASIGEFSLSGPFIGEVNCYVHGGGAGTGIGVIFSPEAGRFGRDLERNTPRPGYSGKGDVRTTWELAQFPDDWRVFTAGEAVALTGADWRGLRAAQREALRNCVARGGQLDFLGAPPESGARLPEEFGGDVLPARDGHRAYGLGQITTGYFGRTRQEGLGWHGMMPERHAFDFSTNGEDPLDRGLPRWTLYGVLGISAALSGPVSLLWLARRRGRHWLFVLLPGIALAATLALVLVVSLRDGFGGRGQRIVLAALVEGRPEMAVHQIEIARCGFLFNRGFSLPEDAMIHAAAHHNTAAEITVRREGTALRGDWFRNRATTFHSITTLVPTRAELQWREPANAAEGPRVLSTFAVPLREVVVTRDGVSWTAAVVPPGVETALRRMTSDQVSLYGNNLRHPEHRGLVRLYETLGVAERFVARLDRLDGAPVETIGSIRWTDHVYVTGPCRLRTGGAR